MNVDVMEDGIIERGVHTAPCRRAIAECSHPIQQPALVNSK